MTTSLSTALFSFTRLPSSSRSSHIISFAATSERCLGRRCHVSQSPIMKFFSSSTNIGTNGQQQDENLSKGNNKRRLDVAIVGAPNAGKSQLLNILTGTTVAAVSRKRHTTRNDILGAVTRLDDDDKNNKKYNNTQIIFKDTPGFMKLENAKEERLNPDLIATAATEMKHVDYTLLVIDAARSLKKKSSEKNDSNYKNALTQLMIGALNARGRIEEDDGYEEEEEEEDVVNIDNVDGNDNKNTSKFAIVLNKVDLVNPKSDLLELAMEIGQIADDVLLEYYGFKTSQPHRDDDNDDDDDDKNKSNVNDDSSNNYEHIDFLMDHAPITFYISALKEDGTDELLEHLFSLATPCRVWAVEAGATTDMSSEEHVQELIREKIYRCLHQEVPHSIEQVNRLFRHVPQGIIIHQDLIVFSKSHQRLVHGKGGKILQRIQQTAERDLKKALGCEVLLHLHVKLNKSKNRSIDR